MAGCERDFAASFSGVAAARWAGVYVCCGPLCEVSNYEKFNASRQVDGLYVGNQPAHAVQIIPASEGTSRASP